MPARGEAFDAVGMLLNVRERDGTQSLGLLELDRSGETSLAEVRRRMPAALADVPFEFDVEGGGGQDGRIVARDEEDDLLAENLMPFVYVRLPAREEALEDTEEATAPVKTVPRVSKSPFVLCFISSTFRDMVAERTLCVRDVFPRLRTEFPNVNLTELDLRWGVTVAEAVSGQVLSICLSRISESQVFVCTLGERYGWVAPVPESIQAQYPWTTEYSGKASITELEVRHAVLNAIDAEEPIAQHSMFYFRNHADFRKSLPADEDLRDYEEADVEQAARMMLLKQTLRDKITDSHAVPLRDYSRPDQFAQMLEQDLRERLQRDFPPEAAPTWLEKERLQHTAFARVRSRVYVGRSSVFAEMDDYLGAETDQPLVVTSFQSGGGKSSLLANWSARPEVLGQASLVLTYFMGTTPASTDYCHALRYILSEIKDHFGQQFPYDVPASRESLRAVFPNWLERAGERGGVILVLDALNQLEDQDDALDLGWLPASLPAGVRIVVSTLPGRCLDAATQRNMPLLDVSPLEVEERRLVCTKLLSSFGKRLEDEQLDLIVSSDAAANPLFLRVLIDELRLAAKFETLSESIQSYLLAEDVPALYELVLARLERDFGSEVCSSALALIWCSNRGLSEPEILELLNISQAAWSSIFLSLKDSLVESVGVFNFFHDALRQAVGRRYVSDPDRRRQHHERLAAFFKQRNPIAARTVEELPYQLSMAKNFDHLRDYLSNVEVFARFGEENRDHVLLGYLSKVVGHSKGMRDSQGRTLTGSEIYELMIREGLNAYRAAHQGQVPPELAQRIAAFLREYGPMGHTLGIGLVDEAIKSTERQIKKHKDDAAKHKAARLTLADLCFDLGWLHYRSRKWDEFSDGLELYQRAMDIRIAECGQYAAGVGACLNHIAWILFRRGETNRAPKVAFRALAMRESALGPFGPDVAQSWHSVGWILLESGSRARSNWSVPFLDRIERCLTVGLHMSRATFGSEHRLTHNIMRDRQAVLRTLESRRANERRAAERRAEAAPE